MSYTVSFEAGQRIKYFNLSSLKHQFRGCRGCITTESSALVSQKTKDNRNLYFDQMKSEFLPCTDISQIMDSLETRLSAVKTSLKRNAVLARGLYLQMDAAWYEEHEPEDTRILNVYLLDWSMAEFGAKNLVGISFQEDCDSPRMYLVFTPVTEDGELSQTDWLESPESMQAVRKSLCGYLHSKGYDVNTQLPEKSMPAADYSAYLKADEKMQELKEIERQFMHRFRQLDAEAAMLSRAGENLKKQCERFHAEFLTLQAKETLYEQDCSKGA